MHDQKQISHRGRPIQWRFPVGKQGLLKDPILDIKPENILLAHHGPDPRVLLADFGAARLADKAFCSMQGTMSYAAPVSRRTLFMIPASSRWAKLNSLNNFPPFSLFMKEVLTVYTRPQGLINHVRSLWESASAYSSFPLIYFKGTMERRRISGPLGCVFTPWSGKTFFFSHHNVS